MNSNILIGSILACTAAAALWLWSAGSAPGPNGPTPVNPSPAPAPSQGPDLFEVFREPKRAEAKSEAVWLAGFFHSLAEQVEWDNGSRFKTWKDFDSQRADALDLLTKGKRYGKNYPSLGKTVAGYLDRPGGNPKLSEPLTLADRNEITSKYRSLGQSCLIASQKL